MGMSAFDGSAACPRFGVVVRGPAPDVLCVMMEEPPLSLPKRAVAAWVYPAVASEIVLTRRLTDACVGVKDPIGVSYAASFAHDPVPESATSLIGVVITGGPYRVLQPPDEKTVRLRSANGSLRVRQCASSEGLHLTAWAGKRRVWHEYYYLGYDVDPDCSEEEWQE